MVSNPAGSFSPCGNAIGASPRQPRSRVGGGARTERVIRRPTIGWRCAARPMRSHGRRLWFPGLGSCRLLCSAGLRRQRQVSASSSRAPDRSPSAAVLVTVRQQERPGDRKKGLWREGHAHGRLLTKERAPKDHAVQPRTSSCNSDETCREMTSNNGRQTSIVRQSALFSGVGRNAAWRRCSGPGRAETGDSGHDSRCWSNRCWRRQNGLAPALKR